MTQGAPARFAAISSILLASIPAAFQLVRIAVEIDGKKFQEMPVYRGAIVRLFLDPRSVDISTSGVHVLAVHGRRI